MCNSEIVKISRIFLLLGNLSTCQWLWGWPRNVKRNQIFQNEQITYLNVLTGLAIWTKRSTWFPQISQLDSSTSSSGCALCARISYHRVFKINNLKSQEENQPETGRRALLLREQRDPTHLRHHGLLVPGGHCSFTTWIGFRRVRFLCHYCCARWQHVKFFF